MSENKISYKTEGRTLVMERVCNAPKDLVFKAFSESEHLENWWGPEGWETETRKFEFVPDGEWHYCMRCTDKKQGDFYGQESWGKTIYKEINVPKKIVYTDVFSDEMGNSANDLPVIQVTIDFIEQEGKTKLILQSQFESIEALQKVIDMGVVEGTDSQYKCLDDYLAQIQHV
ncbi:SRPBCC family protein [Virgibacillus siamensis]|uniref:SRPBCC family protein n=1 Tax=Virgibacillus siamensis TaxID=480071 RepID=UPI0009853C6B|nr:SRPBCC domain-containing protein [Virgibacillus siamensis]